MRPVGFRVKTVVLVLCEREHKVVCGQSGSE